MDQNLILGLAAGVTSLVPYIFYMHDMFLGRTKPERASCLLSACFW